MIRAHRPMAQSSDQLSRIGPIATDFGNLNHKK